jgi:hypothetical protein
MTPPASSCSRASRGSGETAGDVETAVEHPDAVGLGEPPAEHRARDELAEEQRIAARGRPQRVLGTRGHRPAQHVVQQRGHRGSRQVGEVEAPHTSAARLGEEHVRCRRTEALRGHDEHHALLPQPGQQRARHRVEQVDVVDVHHHPAAVGKVAHVGRDAVEERGRVGLVGRGRQQRAEDRQRHGGGRRGGREVGDREPVELGADERLLREPGLAGAGVPDDMHHADRRLVERGGDALEVRRAPDQRPVEAGRGAHRLPSGRVVASARPA